MNPCDGRSRTRSGLLVTSDGFTQNASASQGCASVNSHGVEVPGANNRNRLESVGIDQRILRSPFPPKLSDMRGFSRMEGEKICSFMDFTFRSSSVLQSCPSSCPEGGFLRSAPCASPTIPSCCPVACADALSRKSRGSKTTLSLVTTMGCTSSTLCSKQSTRTATT